MAETTPVLIDGQDGLDAFLQSRHVHWDLSQERTDWWYPYSPGASGRAATRPARGASRCARS